MAPGRAREGASGQRVHPDRAHVRGRGAREDLVRACSQQVHGTCAGWDARSPGPRRGRRLPHRRDPVPAHLPRLTQPLESRRDLGGDDDGRQERPGVATSAPIASWSWSTSTRSCPRRRRLPRATRDAVATRRRAPARSRTGGQHQFVRSPAAHAPEGPPEVRLGRSVAVVRSGVDEGDPRVDAIASARSCSSGSPRPSARRRRRRPTPARRPAARSGRALAAPYPSFSLTLRLLLRRRATQPGDALHQCSVLAGRVDKTRT